MRRAMPHILCTGGALACGSGLWLLHPAAALVFCGALAVAVGVDQYRRQSRKSK